MPGDDVSDMTRGVYRRIYGGYITGQRINKLSLNAEAWFWRVVVTVDDFGNGRAEPELCRDKTAGKRRVTAKQVSAWLREMADAGLIEFYTVMQEPYLHVVGFEENQPAGKNGKRFRRFPEQNGTSGESRIIQVNPGESSATTTTTTNHSDNQDHNHSEDHTDLCLAARARSVFDFWKLEMGHPRAGFDGKREKAVTARLKAGYSVDDLQDAVKGCKLSPYHMGENERQTVWDDIELICRDAAHVEKFIAISENGGPIGTTKHRPSKSDASLDAGRSWVAKKEAELEHDRNRN